MEETRCTAGALAPAAFALDWAPVAPAAPGRAAARLSEFQDV